MGQARSRNTHPKILRDLQKKVDDLQVQSDNKRTPPTISIPPRGTSAPGVTFVDVLKKQGDSMLGPIAFNPHATIIDGSGHIDITPNTDNDVKHDTSYCLVAGAGTPDDLNFIDGAQWNGQYLILQGTNQQVINIKSALNPPNDGNILTPDGNDVVLDGTTTLLNVPAVILVFDPTAPGGAWRVVSGAGGGGAGGLQDPIILNENDLGTIGSITQLIDWSVANFHRAVLNGPIALSMQNLPAAGKWEQVVVEFTQDGFGGHTVSFLDSFANQVIPVVNTGANSKTTIVFYAYNDGVNQILAFDVLSNFGPVSGPAYIHATMVANQNNISVGGRVGFDSILQNSVLSITGTPGIFTGFQAGHVYEVEAMVSVLNAGVTPDMTFKFYDVNQAAFIGTQGNAYGVTGGANESPQQSARAIYIPPTDTEFLEVQLTSNNDVPGNFVYGMGVAGTPASYIMIKDITGFLGGAGTVVNFPQILINGVVEASPGATLNIDLSTSQHWVVNLTQNLTVTFTGLPPDNDTAEQVVIEYIQDGVGGHTVSYTDSIDPSVPVISTIAGAREIVTGFVRRDGLGLYVYNLYLVGA